MGMGLWQGGRGPAFHHPTGWCHGGLCAVTPSESNCPIPGWPMEVEGPGAGVALLLWGQGSGHALWMAAPV